jgi:hypothetical protein
MSKFAGTLDSFSPEQEQVTFEIQRYVKEELKYEHPEMNFWFLLRFGRARHFHLEQTKLMVKLYVEYKREQALKKVMEIDYFQNLEPIQRHIEGGLFHIDREGRPVYYLLFGKCDFVNLFKKYSIDEVLLAHIHLLERFVHVILPACSKILNRRIEHSMAIVDFKDVALIPLMKGPVREFGEKFSYIAQNYFPETLGKMFFINVPIIFSLAWKLVKPWLHKNTRQRIQIYSSNGREEIQKVIDVENLHVIFGGKKNEDYKAHPGPWDDKFQKSLSDRTFYPENYTEAFYTHYLTPKEKLEFDKVVSEGQVRIPRFLKDLNESSEPQKIRSLDVKVDLPSSKRLILLNKENI